MRKQLFGNVRIKHIFIVLGYLFIMFALSSCFANRGLSQELNPAGFFKGIWHGWIAPFSLILGFFDRSISVYEVNNTGWWYDLGFYVAVISPFGSLSITRSKEK